MKNLKYLIFILKITQYPYSQGKYCNAGKVKLSVHLMNR
jgi:hypothetical protein